MEDFSNFVAFSEYPNFNINTLKAKHFWDDNCLSLKLIKKCFPVDLRYRGKNKISDSIISYKEWGPKRFSVYPSHQFSLVGCIFVTSAVGSPTNDDRNPILFADRELLCTMVWKFYKRTFPPFKMVTSLIIAPPSQNRL